MLIAIGDVKLNGIKTLRSYFIIESNGELIFVYDNDATKRYG